MDGMRIDRWRFASFTEFCRELHETFPTFSVTRWFSSVAHNAALPGHASDSEHLTATAIDGTFDPGTAPDPGYFKAWCRERGVDVEQVAAIASSGGPLPAGETATVPGENPHWHLQLRTTLP